MVKVLLFFGLVFGVMLYPLFISSNEKAKANVQIVKLPDVVFNDGKFYMYEGNLSKTGKFKMFELYDKGYIVNSLYLSDLVRNEEYKAKRTVFKDDIVTGYDVWYKNRDFELITNLAHFDKHTKILEGGKFEIYSTDFKGRGNSFEIDNKKDLYAQNIIYYLKVKK